MELLGVVVAGRLCERLAEVGVKSGRQVEVLLGTSAARR